MTWECKLIDVIDTKKVTYDTPKENGIVGEILLITSDNNEYSIDDLPIGTMFYVLENKEEEDLPYYYSKNKLSDYYLKNNSHRRPLYVLLPGKYLFLIDGKCNSGDYYYSGWEVTGIAPNITISPSINVEKKYHGWIKNGIISVDCEGRKFDSNGYLIR